MIRDPVANFAGAAAVVAPSLLAVPLALRDVSLGRTAGRERTAPSLVSLFFSLACIVFVFAATAYDMLRPPAYPCL